jgi:hypothetical protein
MSLYEASHDAPQKYPFQIPIPEEANDNWCGMVTDLYGGTGTRIVVEAVDYLRMPRQPKCIGRTAMPWLRENELPFEKTAEDVLFDGELISLRSVPRKKMVEIEPEIEDDEPYQYKEPVYDRGMPVLVYVPHVVIKDVEDVISGWRPVPKNEAIWVPLSNTDEELNFY